MDLSVKCACGRTMTPLGTDGDPRFRCGCRASITILGYAPPSRRMCPMIYEGRRCPRPKQPNDPTCTECSITIASHALKTPDLRRRLATLAAYGRMQAERDAAREARIADEERRAAGRLTDYERRKALLECDVVYYVNTKPGIVKIGTTKNLYSRMYALRVSPDDVLAAEPGDRQLEAMRHKEFAELRISRREDFHHTDRLQSHIDMIVAQFGKPGDLVTDLRTRRAEELA